MTQELKDINNQLNEGGKLTHAEQKMRRRLEIEKDKLRQALEEAETTLEAKESKVLRAQVDIF